MHGAPLIFNTFSLLPGCFAFSFFFFWFFWGGGVERRLYCQLLTTYQGTRNTLNSQNRLKIRTHRVFVPFKKTKTETSSKLIEKTQTLQWLLAKLMDFVFLLLAP